MAEFEPSSPDPRSSLRSKNKVRALQDQDLGFASSSVVEDDIEQFAEESGVDEEDIERWIRAIRRKGQAIFYGPPGTGKTYNAERIAEILTGTSDNVTTIQFHPSYSYEEFIEGIRPEYDDADDTLKYPTKKGRFVEFCDEARNSDGNYVLIIDELNRAEVSAVFGELMHLLEYRGKEIPLPQSDREFSVPENIYVLGTMNTADRSIALVDYALRRRFAMIEIGPDYDVLRTFHDDTGHDVDGLIETLKEINEEAIGDEDFYLGITYFLESKLDEYIEDIWVMEIEPYLEEYFFDEDEVVDEYRWDAVKDDVRP
ncbi:AAA family ATPase [Haloferax larsenii]|uniref:AAA family ATPase n=1 Tax=Haloferax larsenii TaxID=302484 RepID=A0ABY5RBT8_HALLR|nr:AAA family ATPase [Haloferax larsenii]UVE49654.1 AAA family ATPase [Haloferax larsenii]